MSVKKKLVDEIFKPNSKGISEWLSRETLDKTKLKLTNNGNVRHNVIFGVNEYKWEFTRINDKQTGKIVKIRTNGLSDNKISSRPISNNIKKIIKTRGEENGCVECGSKTLIVCDHKNDLYNDKNVLNTKTQKLIDFQPLCNGCNLRKREINKQEHSTKKIFSVKSLTRYDSYNFIFPWEKKCFDELDINCKKDTYWYDPKEFNEKILLYTLYRIPINNMVKKYIKIIM